MGGHVAGSGVYSLSARKITIKQAVISAGMFDGLAIPQRTEIYRRIGVAREALVRVDLDAIFSGDQPDIYLKPNDVVQVGTNVLAPFIAAVRQGFRITYGFGFLYDRNFAPIQNGTCGPGAVGRHPPAARRRRRPRRWRDPGERRLAGPSSGRGRAGSQPLGYRRPCTQAGRRAVRC